jgi:hypothetical protein
MPQDPVKASPEIVHAFSLTNSDTVDDHMVAYCPCGWSFSHSVASELSALWYAHLPPRWTEALEANGMS